MLGEREHPTPEAVRQLLEKVDTDPEWFPGQQNENKRDMARKNEFIFNTREIETERERTSHTKREEDRTRKIETKREITKGNETKHDKH